jgi:hypothetical protein
MFRAAGGLVAHFYDILGLHGRMPVCLFHKIFSEIHADTSPFCHFPSQVSRSLMSFTQLSSYPAFLYVFPVGSVCPIPPRHFR